MSDMRDDRATGKEGVGRFLRGSFTERFLPHWREGEIRGGAGAVLAAPITVTLTDQVRGITDTAPATGEITCLGARVTAITGTIPEVTRNITVIP